ncbi:MAG TPA: phage holin family protein [Sphingomonas sp.]|jgi:hypothetical protein|uniref:phage holin family protein n=1 Tax=Sphingomonas sp. TaxID=28214 RepID=UPI002ED8A7BC
MIPPRDIADDSVGTLLQRLADDGRAYVRAEVDVARASVRARVGSAKVAIIAGFAALFIAQAGLTVLFLAIGSALAMLMPLWAGQLLAALLALAAAGLLVKYAIAHASPPTGDPEPAVQEDRT